MPVYTKTGDRGTTALFGGRRISKADIQIEAYGSIDELSSFIGLVFAKLKDKKEKNLLLSIQKDLYEIMAVLSNAKVDLNFLENKITFFEKEIDRVTKKLKPLTRFVLPSGNETTALYHVARAVCRRAERNVVRFQQHATRSMKHGMVIKYLNRLSDLFFTLARKNTKGKEHIT